MPYGSPSTLIYRPQPQPSKITIPMAGSPASRLVPCSESPPRLKPVIY